MSRFAQGRQANQITLLASACLVALVGCESPPSPSGARAERGHIHLLFLEGTPYEMGLQHGELMAEELAEAVDWLESDPDYSAFLELADLAGLIEDALERSYPDVLDECRGIVDGAAAAGVVDLSIDMCIGLAYADVMLEFIEGNLPTGCTQLAAAGAATPEGSLVHGRNMDNSWMSYVIEHPTIIVRRPAEGIPYLEVGFPGSVSPHSGMNAEGIAVASNQNQALDDFGRAGRSHIQMSRQILQSCASLEEAAAFLEAQDHASAESLMISDGQARNAAVFEMTASHLGARHMEDGLVYMSNHFVHPDMAERHLPLEPEASSHSRFARLEQLLLPGGEESLYGALDVEAVIEVLRDTHNPVTGQTHPPDLFEGGGSIANNAALHSMVFVPEQRVVYVALGEPPVPQRTFVGFSLDALLAGDGLGETDPLQYE